MMKARVLKKLVVFLMVAAFALASGLAFAASKYVGIKDKKGICRVVKAKGKTSKTIAGPFDTKAEAQKAKAEKCPSLKKKKK